tara:strand:- start:234 stop:443 length:210 start_codon:yes stop_codon:yes gene_type:complete
MNPETYDQTGSFLYQTFTGITTLSDNTIKDIQALFETYNNLLSFILSKVDITLLEAIGLCDTVFPFTDV